MHIYRSERAKQKIMETNDKLLTQWGTPLEEMDIGTSYGSTHIIVCGQEQHPPLILFHGVGDDSALMWIYNAKKLAEHFRIYAVDTVGGPGKSRPNASYTKSFDRAGWIDDIFESLGLHQAYLAGTSNGAYMVQHYAILRPEKVIKAICMSGSAASGEAGKSPLWRMLKVFLPEALFPTDSNVARLIRKLAGRNYKRFTESPAIMEHYAGLLRGFNNMAMANHKIKAFTPEQISSLQGKCLFLCGENDPLGSREPAEKIMQKHQLEYRFFPDVGHGINHEIPDEINRIIIEYFSASA